MPRTTYLHANGRAIAQVKDGVRTDYLTDALGSITATKNQSQQIVNTYRWKPYGGMLARTGIESDDPKYGWTGDTGSRRTFTQWVNQYNVFRHYGSQQAAWTTVDPLWPDEWAYGLVGGRPVGSVDPLGLAEIVVQICAFIDRRQADYKHYKKSWAVLPGVLISQTLAVNTNRRTFGEDPFNPSTACCGGSRPLHKSNAGSGPHSPARRQGRLIHRASRSEATWAASRSATPSTNSRGCRIEPPPR